MDLQISNLSKRYGNNWVLRDVSFEVASGNVLAILGRARSGKSTILRILAGREDPSPRSTVPGTEGRAIDLVTPERQRPAFWFFAHRDADPKVSIPRALEKAADILLFDDPLRSCPKSETEAGVESIRETVKRRGLTAIYATEDFETAALVGDEIAVLADGYIQQYGIPQDVYESPATTGVARVTGRCNIFSARRLTSTKFDIPEFQTIEGDHRLFTERADISKLGAINRNVSLAIRPENISMSFGASFPEDNLLKAVVISTKFLGPVTLVELNANGLILNAMVFRLVGLDVGQECMLGLPPDRVKILKD